ncbi:hypothetical protein U9M48_043260 [Paspalum notatum var. saurae]|uniref:Chromo domain-containing protein n=1 Tax=Paspalum notatum var. saurae TaxID=547442 RepID=A0AAQ3XFE2_PASNO
MDVSHQHWSLTKLTSLTHTVDDLLQYRDEFLVKVQQRLRQAQEYSRRGYNMHRDMHFNVGDQVSLCILQPPGHVPGSPLERQARPSLCSKVQEHVGNIVYKLWLPTGARVHNVFHMGLLKPYHGAAPTRPPSLPSIHNGRHLPQPLKLLRTRLHHGTWHVLVHWACFEESEATWEALD